MLGQVGGQTQLLIGSQTVTPHQGKQSTVLGSDAIDSAPTSQEVMVNDTDHMETVGHAARMGEVEPHQSPVVGSQVHAYHSHVGFALQALEIGFQGELSGQATS